MAPTQDPPGTLLFDDVITTAMAAKQGPLPLQLPGHDL